MKIFKYLKKYWFFALLAPIFMIGEVLMDLEQPMLMSDIIDIGLKNKDLEFVINTGIKMLLYVLAGGCFGVLCGVFTNIAAFKFACKVNGLNMELLKSNLEWSEFKTNSDGMVPVIVQDYKTNEVLQLAYMNEESFKETLASGKMTYWSRSRNELWKKGMTSGHYQYVKSLTADCDRDTILAKVSQVGAACHTGKRSCFFEEIAKKEYEETNISKVFEDVYGVIADRKVNPKEGSYTNYLFDKGIDKILKKVGEEATEIVIAAKNPEAEEIKYEIADFLYHVMVLMVERGVTWEDIIKELANR